MSYEIKNGVGCSKHTKEKQSELSLVMQKLIEYHVKKSNGNFFYVDMNAGPGVYNGFKGSPLIFIDIAEKMLQNKYTAWMLERNPDNYGVLCSNIMRMKTTGTILPLLGDNETLLPSFVRSALGKNGLIYCDPCGTDIPFQALGDLLHQQSCNNVDVLVHCDARSFKRHNRIIPSIGASISLLRKKWVFVSKPSEVVKTSEWVFIYGTNSDKWSIFEYLGEKSFTFSGDSDFVNNINKLSFTKEDVPLIQKNRSIHRRGKVGNKGTKNGNSKLTEEIVLRIRDLRKNGYSYAAISAELGYEISEASIGQVCRNESWRHVA